MSFGENENLVDGAARILGNKQVGEIGRAHV